MKKSLCQKKLRNRQWVILSVLLLSAVMPVVKVYAAQENPTDSNQLILRVRVFTLRTITAPQAKDYLQSAQIADTVLAIPGTTAISVTGNAEQLVYATSVIRLVDANEKYDIRFFDITPGKVLPAPDKIETKLGRGYSVGTLLDGPSKEGTVRTIVSLFKDKLLVIAPQEQINKIAETVQASLVEKPSQTEPNQAEPNYIEPNQQNLLQAAASANDITFTQEPNIIEPNSPRGKAAGKIRTGTPVKIKAEPNQPIAQHSRDTKTEDDDMLNGYINELSEAAKIEKVKREYALAKAAAEPPVKSDVKQQSATIAQKAAEQNQPADKPIAEPAAEEFFEEEKQEQPKLAKTEPVSNQKQKEQPQEANESVQQPAEEIKAAVMPDVDIPNGDELLELNLPEKLELVSLIDLVGKYLNLNYLYDETKVTGSVTIKVQGRLRVRELYNLLESVLKFRGFVMTRKDRLVTIVPTAEALDQDPTFGEHIKAGDVITTNVFHLKYITTATAKKLLGEMKLAQNITEIPETGTLVITEYSFRMQRIEDLLSLVDMPGPPREFKLRVLNYTIAEVLVPKIQALAEQLGTVDITVGTSAQAAAPAAAAPRARRQPTPAAQPQPTDTTKKTGVFIDFDKRTNRVLMIGLPNELAAVEQIIDTLDVPQQDLRVIREYEIQYVDIDKVVEALGELGVIEVTGGTGGGVGPKTVIPKAGGEQPQAPAPAAAAAAGGTGQVLVSLDQPQVVKLESTNSLLINATPEQHIQVARIISYIDREPIEAAIPYRIYRLENQEPEALAEVLNNLIQQTIKDKEGKIQQTIKYTEENIAIVPDKNTFSLIVYASKKNQEWIGNLIKSLDRRRPQVLIDVSLVEITRDDKFQFDLDVVANARDLVQNSLVINGDAINTIFPATSPSKTLLEGGYFGTTNNVRGFYNEGRIQALLDLIDSKKYGRVLARPKVLVNDNETGTISSEDTRYILTQSNATLPGTAGAAAPDTVVVSTTYTPYTAKIELKITPQISEGSLLRLEIEMQRNDFQDAASSTDGPPNEKKSIVNTIVTVPDGSTIILGGLTKLNQVKNANKVPLLGDVPVVGALFRGVSKTDLGNSKLYVFVKANILRPEENFGLQQLKDISRANKAEFEEGEAQFQKYELFPGVKETPIEPVKVLEQGVVEPNENKLSMKIENIN